MQKSFSRRYRIPLFVVFYAGVFAALALLSYFVAIRSTAPQHIVSAKPYTFATDFTYIDLPRMAVSVSGNNNMVHMQIDIALEVAKKDAPILDGYKPRLVDRLNRFFSKLRPSQVTSPDSLPWLRGELLKQVNDADLPVSVHAVWLQRFIVTQPTAVYSHLVISPSLPTS